MASFRSALESQAHKLYPKRYWFFASVLLPFVVVGLPGGHYLFALAMLVMLWCFLGLLVVATYGPVKRFEKSYAIDSWRELAPPLLAVILGCCILVTLAMPLWLFF